MKGFASTGATGHAPGPHMELFKDNRRTHIK
jgi:hypothetical protein